MHQKILILDFGSQYTQLIARRVREASVYCELHPNDVSEQFIREFAPSGIILSGGPSSVYEEETPRAPDVVFQLGVPVLGICYGMQTMAAQLGGKVENAVKREFGYAEIRAQGHSALLRDIQDRNNAAGHGLLDVWMSHGDKVTELPPGFRIISSNAATPIAGMADEERRFYGVQFHPEVTHTSQGKAILARFVHDICGCGSDWNMPDYVEEAIGRVRSEVGSDEVILGLSGGVDSSVVAALLHRAIGNQLTCVFVDNGLLRLNEAEQVMQTFADNLGVKVIHVDASERFMTELAGVSDPEQKRKIIGREFVHVFQEQAEKLPNAKWLAQGTIYPDVIESASAKTKKAHTIKSHHNVGGLPDTLHLKLLEPLRELFKDEVRELGIALGLPHDMVYRHPFPGPGLGRAHPRRSPARFCRPAAPGRRHLHRGTACQRLVRENQPGLRRVPAGEERRRHGRRPHLRLRRRTARRADPGLHDRPLGRTAVYPARQGLQSHHQRDTRHQPRRLRHQRQAAGHDRMGIKKAAGKADQYFFEEET
jgi:GMP synthase (glutamine-hydrolysing)